MRPTLPALAAVLLTPMLLAAQVRPPEARPVPAAERPARAEMGRACELSAGDGLTLAFAVCPAPGAGSTAKEVEIVEYRNGDAPQRVTALSVNGVVHRDLAVRSLSWSDPDDDGDGVPTLAADATARRAPGRIKVGRMTLRRTETAGSGAAALPWQDGDLDSDGLPDVAVRLEEPSGATTTFTFQGCRAAASAPDAATDEVVLVCREVRGVAALDANPYARLIAGATDHPEADLPLLDRRTPPSAGAAGSRQGARTFRLEGARLESWSVDFDPARPGTGSWTLEVRVERIEMA